MGRRETRVPATAAAYPEAGRKSWRRSSWNAVGVCPVGDRTEGDGGAI